MNNCRHCGQGAIAQDAVGPVCPDCFEEGYVFSDLPQDADDMCEHGVMLRAKKSAVRFPEISGRERARAERSAEIYGSGYLVLVNGEWRSFCGEEVKVIKKTDRDALAAERDTLKAENERLREVIDVDPWKVGFAHWKALRARAALQENTND